MKNSRQTPIGPVPTNLGEFSWKRLLLMGVPGMLFCWAVLGAVSLPTLLVENDSSAVIDILSWGLFWAAAIFVGWWGICVVPRWELEDDWELGDEEG